MIGTGVVGLVLGLLYLWLGSLVPVQIIHAFVNLSSGFMCVVLMRAVRSGVQAPVVEMVLAHR